MKYLLASAAIFLLAPVSAMAISLSEITDNPSQYKQLLEDKNHILYLDTNSVESLRYSPPYYTMRGTFYLVSYSSNEITSITLTADYDYNRSARSIRNIIAKYDVQNNVYETKDSFWEKYCREKNNDCGISMSTTELNIWDLDGNFINNAPSAYNKTPNFESNGYQMASDLFEQYYNEEF